MAPTTTLASHTCLAGAGLERISPAEIVVESGVIKDVRVRQADGSPDVDLGPLTVIPGFIDAHVHIGFFPPADVLAGGVTTVRDLGWPPERIYPLVRRSEEPGFDGPRVLAAGPILTSPGGYPTRAAWAPAGTGREVTDLSDARAAVGEQVAAGAAIVKVALSPEVGPVLDASTLTEICASAAEHGLRVTAHISRLIELEKALDAGVRELAHMLLSRESIPDEILARMAGQDVACVPTLSIHRGRQRRAAIENLARFGAAGGQVLYGTDLGNDGPGPGIDAREVAGMQAAGMDGHSIVASATSASAARLGLSTVGAIAPGMQADLVGVDGDPLSDPSVLPQVRFVMRAGEIHRGPR